MEKGLVHIYTGDGKGKTTASFGLAMRCAGYGKSIKIFQFLKGIPSGEVTSCNILGISISRVSSSDKFYFQMNHQEKEIAKNESITALKDIYKHNWDMIILDEVLGLIENDIITEGYLIDIINAKPKNTELVITGRNMPQSLTKYADYISEIKEIKHPFQNNIPARKSIDF